MQTHPEPYWRDSIDLPNFEPLHKNVEVEALIVGGGITGITAAYLLANEGVQVALIDADRLLNGTTGHTTAKITAQHRLIYDELIHHMGRTKARLYYESNMDGLELIKNTVEQQQIDCDFRHEDAWVYAVTAKEARKIEQEYEAYQALRIDGELRDAIPFDLKVQNALVMKNQAQFHPLKYLAHLVQQIQAKGGALYEYTTAVDVEEGTHPTVLTRDGQRIRCKSLLVCSHYPFCDKIGLYFTRLHAERAYVIAGNTDISYPGGMYISSESPTRSIRSVQINGETMVLISGESHKTGQGKDTMEHYNALESFGREVLGLKEVFYRWSTQDLYTLDKVAYIGKMSNDHPNILVATGYRKWGMTTSTAAALLLRDLVVNRKNPYQELYDPSRLYVDPSLKTFLTQNADVAGHLVTGKLQLVNKNPHELSSGEGAVVTFNGKRAGAFRDEEGTLYVVDTTCRHMGCEVEWNHGDKTWDCPCHGSRYTYRGEVVEGPAKQPLHRLQ